MLVDVAITIYSMHFIFSKKKVLGERNREREFHSKTNLYIFYIYKKVEA